MNKSSATVSLYLGKAEELTLLPPLVRFRSRCWGNKPRTRVAAAEEPDRFRTPGSVSVAKLVVFGNYVIAAWYLSGKGTLALGVWKECV